MAITYSDVTNRTGDTYSSTSNPTSTQVTAFITGAKNIVKGANGGTAVDETVQEQIEIVLDVVDILVHNYKVEQRSLGTPSIQFQVPEKKWPTINDSIKEKIALAWPGSRSGMEHVAGSTRYWK